MDFFENSVFSASCDVYVNCLKYLAIGFFDKAIRHRIVTQKSNIGKNQRKFKKMKAFCQFGPHPMMAGKPILPRFAEVLAACKILLHIELVVLFG